MATTRRPHTRTRAGARNATQAFTVHVDRVMLRVVLHTLTDVVRSALFPFDVTRTYVGSSVCCATYLMLASPHLFFFFFFNDTAPPEISTLPPHDALPI